MYISATYEMMHSLVWFAMNACMFHICTLIHSNTIID